ncbi:hypothetical protein CEXT_43411 [Caerostris extrusa]|uniref:Uncharacterized protein n=1 Tax=Caerostris extrusa TaxID=172846 RepID=A0AAV4XAW2_CAEEX|nr:hypothetical protein CEXT_43411 [Caerostris extrusa]
MEWHSDTYVIVRIPAMKTENKLERNLLIFEPSFLELPYLGLLVPWFTPIRRKSNKSLTASNELFKDPITSAELLYAIQQLDFKKSPGPDGIHGQFIVSRTWIMCN